MASDQGSAIASPFEPHSKSNLDLGKPVTWIGSGSFGGKAQGLIDIREALQAGIDSQAFPGVAIDIPEMTVLRTGVFDSFMERNHLHDQVGPDSTDQRVAHAFQKADLPFEILGELRALVERVRTPIAVRSSSLLEDAQAGPFAGIYVTKMIPNSQYDPDLRFRQLVEAIKLVYASTYFKAAVDYRQAIGREDAEEKMAVILQEVVGKRHPSRFYPELSGVARSDNYYPMPPARPEDGVVNLALGLGKTIVDGGIAWIYSPAYPKVDPPYGSVRKMLGGTQHEFWAINMGEPAQYDPIHETEYLVHENLAAAEQDEALRFLASTYDTQSDRLSIGTGLKGPRALTFAPLLVLEQAPLNAMIVTILKVAEAALHGPVEIEFAMTFNPHRFALLQVRRIAVSEEVISLSEEALKNPDLLVASTQSLGNGSEERIQDIVYIKPENFQFNYTQAIALELRTLNRKLLDLKRPYLLVAIGRLGTTDEWLGVPVKWGEICGARAVVEVAQQNAKVELSQGSHYFHNIINLGVKYFNVAFNSPYRPDWDWLDRQPMVEETRFVRHVRLESPLQVRVDGRTGRGVICKPQG
jgi:hypothetical protein